MLSIAIIGLGTFGEKIIDTIQDSDVDIIIIDKDRDIVEKYKDIARDSYITDAIDSKMLHKIIPEDIDTVVVDLGAQMESSILVTNELKKMGVKKIVVKASSNQHGEILKIVGATHIVFPDEDAAQRITPLLISSVLFDYIKLSSSFGIAEIKVKKELEGKTLAESRFRQTYNLNVIAYRENQEDEFIDIQGATTLKEGMRVLVAGSDENINKYIEEKSDNLSESTSDKKRKSSFFGKFSNFGKK